MFLASQGAPTWAPNGPQVAFRANFGFKIYENRVRESSERALGAKKSSQDRFWNVLERLGGVLEAKMSQENITMAEKLKKVPKSM